MALPLFPEYFLILYFLHECNFNAYNMLYLMSLSKII